MVDRRWDVLIYLFKIKAVLSKNKVQNADTVFYQLTEIQKTTNGGEERPGCRSGYPGGY